MIEHTVADGIATVVLSRPPANAINREWTQRFHAILDELATRDDWSVLHIRSALRLFSAGADIKEMRAVFESKTGVDLLLAAVRDYQALFARIESLPAVTLAEIGGAALGGGFELALACDLRVVADDARVGLPEIRIGLLPGAGGTQRLTRLCGRATAIRVMNGAEMIDGRAAVALGLAQWTFPVERLADAAVEIARRYASQSALASRLIKGCVTEALDPLSQRGFDLEYEGTRQLLASEETRSLVTRFLAAKEAR